MGVNDEDEKEMHKRKRSLTRKLDRKILPLIWSVLDNDGNEIELGF